MCDSTGSLDATTLPMQMIENIYSNCFKAWCMPHRLKNTMNVWKLLSSIKQFKITKIFIITLSLSIWIVLKNGHAMPTHGNHTNNYVESHFKIIKENVMHRHKCYNLPDFLDLMMKESSEYYRRICLSNGRFNPRQSKYKIPEKLSISREKVTKISDSIFMVESLRLSYIFQFAEWIGNIFPGCKITSGIHFTVSLSLFKFGAHSVWY